MGYFDYVIRQQEAKDKEEAREQELALSLLAIDVRQAGYEDALVGQYGPQNLIKDTETDRLRVKTEDEGFDLKLTPEFKLKELTAELEDDRFEKTQTLQYNMRTLDRKIEKEAAIRQRIITKYPTLDPKYLTSGGPAIVKAFNKVSADENENRRQEIKDLTNEIVHLTNLEQELAGQAVYYETARGGLEGLNLILDPQEFDKLTQEYKEKYPGRPIAGLTQAYFAGKTSKARRYELTKGVGKEYEVKAEADLVALKNMMSVEDFSFEGIEGAEDDEQMQSVMLQAAAFPSYTGFLSFLDREPSGKVKKAFYSFAPGLMRDMEENSESIAALHSEFLGVDEEAETKKLLDKFKSDIGEIKNYKEAFHLYKNLSGKLPGREMKDKFFNAMESELFGWYQGDLGEAYVDWLKEDKIDPSKGVRVSQSELILKPFEGQAGTVEETAENVYNALDKITSAEATSNIKSLTLNLSAKSVLDVPGAIIERPNYSAGKAILGGQLGFDSPYYDAFYDSIDESFKQLVQEEDPWGPDWLYYGLAEEHMTPELLKERYGLDAYNRAIDAADQVGREAQIKEIGSVLKKKTGEDYFDLIRTLNSIKE